MSSKRKEKEEKNTRENYGILADCGAQTCPQGVRRKVVAPCFLMELNGLVICVVAFRQM